MYTLKQLTVEGIERAMQKAERYRLLGEPCEAESICMDVLQVDPDHHHARVTLVLALTDQFRRDLSRVAEAAKMAGNLKDEYERLYYSGVVAERHGKAQLEVGGPSSNDYANRALREAMEWYGRAEAIRPPGDDNAILRWNTCARAISRRGFQEPRDMARPALFMTE
jgi:hypothetical protein